MSRHSSSVGNRHPFPAAFQPRRTRLARRRLQTLVGRPIELRQTGTQPSPNERAIEPCASIHLPRLHPIPTDQFPVRILWQQPQRFDEVAIDDEEVSSIRQ